MVGAGECAPPSALHSQREGHNGKGKVFCNAKWSGSKGFPPPPPPGLGQGNILSHLTLQFFVLEGSAAAQHCTHIHLLVSVPTSICWLLYPHPSVGYCTHIHLLVSVPTSICWLVMSNSEDSVQHPLRGGVYREGVLLHVSSIH